MNEFRFPGSQTRIVLWVALWLACFAIAGLVMFKAGWPWRVAALERYMYSGNGWVHGAFTIEKLRAAKLVSDRFVLIGGSACLEGITSDSDAESRLRTLTGNHSEFASVCSSYTTFSDVAKIVDRIGAGGGTVLLLLEPGAFGKGPDIQLDHHVRGTGKLLPKYYYLPVPGWLGAVFAEYGVRVPWGYEFQNYAKAAPVEIIKSVLRGVVRRENFTYKRHLLTKRADEERILQAVKDKLPPENIAMNKALLRAIIRSAQGYGNKVALVEIPNAETYRDAIHKQFPAYDSFMAGLVGEFGIEHIDLRNVVPWPSEDFWDTHHMTPQGREKFTRLLVGRLAELKKSEVPR